MSTSIRRLRTLPLLLVAVLLAGCSLRGGVYDLPLPGGADLGAHPITIEAEFNDVLDLVPHSSVKLDNVDVGQVSAIHLVQHGRAAEVTMRIRGGLSLSADSTARLEQSSLLGEKYVALASGRSDAPLRDGAELGPAATSRAVDAEQVLGALSMLLSGGGVAQLQTISREITKIGDGRTPQIRQFLRGVDTLVATLNTKRVPISRAIDRMGALSRTLKDNRAAIDDVLTRLTPGLQEVSDQRADLVRMLGALDRLSGVTVRVLHASAHDMTTTFRQLRPVLDRLAASGADLPRSLEILPTFPFTDAILDAVKGDYINAFITMTIVQQTTSQPASRWPYPTSNAPPVMLPNRATHDATAGTQQEVAP